jgi:hypothetical protein
VLFSWHWFDWLFFVFDQLTFRVHLVLCAVRPAGSLCRL